MEEAGDLPFISGDCYPEEESAGGYKYGGIGRME
jgi:hypothetical protein